MRVSARKLASLVLLSLFGLSACGSERTFPPPAPTPDHQWTMTLTQTGGFAGVHLVIQVTSAGEMNAEDQRAGRFASLPLQPGELAELDRLRQGLTSERSARLPSACADCFNYDLEIASPAGIIRVQADDTTLAASGAQTLIEYLREMRDRALSSGS
jgi:hypothetical protein